MKPDHQFGSVLRRSREAVWAIASLLHKRGRNVRIKPALLTPSRERRYEFVDDGDLEIVASIEVSRKVEVKWWQEKNFSCARDFPYPQIIVDEGYKIDKLLSDGIPFSYYIISADGEFASIVNSESVDKWVRKSVFDRVENGEREFYFAPLDCCFWVTLPHDCRPAT